MNNNLLIFVSIFLLASFTNCNNGSKKIESKENTLQVEIDTLKVDFTYFVDNGDTMFQPIVSLGSKVIYDFKKDTIFTYRKSRMKTIIVRNTTYLLFPINDPLLRQWIIIEVPDSMNVVVYKNVLRGILDDIDEDGVIEVGGQEIMDAICVDCDSAYYSPYRIYKLENSLTFDSLLSRKLTEKQYGIFLGYNCLDTIIKTMVSSFNDVSDAN